MYMSARERQIIEILLQHEEGITVKEIADELEVSSRTIHRDIKALESEIKPYDLKIVKKAGTGIKLEGEFDNKQLLASGIETISNFEYTAEERQTYLVCELLEKEEPIKLYALADNLKVTVATISHDLDEVEEWLKEYDLMLIRKRGYGVDLQGSERAKRRALSKLFVTHFDYFDIMSFLKRNIRKNASGRHNFISDRLLGLVNENRLIQIEQVTEEITNQLPYKIADSSFVGLTVHLALAVERLLKGETIELDQNSLSILKKTKEYHFAKQLVKKIEGIFDIQVPNAEIGYITMHLRGAKLQNGQILNWEDTDIEIASKAKSLIRHVEIETDIPLHRSTSLYNGLVTHLERSMYRIYHGMKINNPLLHQIKTNYADLFRIIESAVKDVFPTVDIPEEEIGFLVMHFGSMIEKEEAESDLNALLICSSGIGTSKMLGTRLQKILPQIKHLTSASLFEVNEMDDGDFDIILSTVPLPLDKNKYLQVSPFLNSQDVNKVKAHLSKNSFEPELNHEDTNIDRQEDLSLSQREQIEFFNTIGKQAEFAENLLEQLSVTPIQNTENTDVLLNICEILQQRGLLSNAKTVTKELKQREQLSGLGIPNTSMALYHSKSDKVIQSSFTIYSLQQPIVLKAMDGTDISVIRLMVLLAPNSLDTSLLNYLSLISSSIIESKENMQIFETQSTELIANLLYKQFSQHLEENFQNKRWKPNDENINTR